MRVKTLACGSVSTQKAGEVYIGSMASHGRHRNPVILASGKIIVDIWVHKKCLMRTSESPHAEYNTAYLCALAYKS